MKEGDGGWGGNVEKAWGEEGVIGEGRYNSFCAVNNFTVPEQFCMEEQSLISPIV